MSPERKEMLISYSKFRNIWRFVSFFIEIIILAILLYTGLSARFKRWAEAISKKKFFVYLFYILFFSLFIYIVNLPFDYYRGFIVEHDYGFSNQTTGEWFVESFKSMGIVFILGFIVISILYWLINRTKRWWLWFAVGSLPFMVFIIIIAPVVINPLFNKFEPLKDPHLADEMTQLAARAEIHNPDIFQVDASKQSNRLNAYFTGMFGTKRIVLYDNIIEAFTVDELKYVMGHEIGHYKMHHIWKGLFLAILLIFVALFVMDRALPGIIRRNRSKFGFEKLGDIASLPLVWLFIAIFGFITQPVNNGVSRHMEYNADEYGLKLSGVTAETAAITFDKLSVYNLSDPDPSAIIEFWFYDHPALNKRIDNVRKLYDKLQTGS
jgi:Zn-dependent protease with chaperone function